MEYENTNRSTNGKKYKRELIISSRVNLCNAQSDFLKEIVIDITNRQQFPKKSKRLLRNLNGVKNLLKSDLYLMKQLSMKKETVKFLQKMT